MFTTYSDVSAFLDIFDFDFIRYLNNKKLKTGFKIFSYENSPSFQIQKILLKI